MLFRVTEAGPGRDFVEGGKYLAPQFEDVEFAGLAVEDFAVRRNEQGVREGAVPFGIESFDHFVFVGVAKVIVFRRSEMLLQKTLDLIFLVGKLGGHGDEFEIAMTETEIGFDEIVELGNARAAPGGPEIDEANFSGIFVRAQIVKLRGGDGFERDGFFVNFFDPTFVGIDLVIPLRGATEDFGLLNGGSFARENCLERIAGVVMFNEAFAFGIVDAALVSEFASGIENKNVRCGNGAECFGG